MLAISVALAARVKDVTALYGVRDNPLVGYGLVVGLNRTGTRPRTSRRCARSETGCRASA